MNKKGESNQSPDIIGIAPNFATGVLVAALIIVLVAAPLIYKPVKMLLSNPKDQINTQTFNLLNREIDKVLKGDVMEIRELYFQLVGEDNYLVGLNKDSNEIFTSEFIGPIVNRPDDCGNDACLCLFKKKGFKDPVCKRYPEVDEFMTIPFIMNHNLFGVETEYFPNVYVNFMGSKMMYSFEYDGHTTIGKLDSERELTYMNLVIYSKYERYNRKEELGFVPTYVTLMKQNGGREAGGKNIIFISPECEFTEELRNE